MSANNDDDKESHKSVPLDLARNQITSVRTVEGKAPLVMTSTSLRGMRVLTQGISSSGNQNITGPTILATNIVSQAVLKQDPNRTQITNIINSSSQSQQQTQSQSNITLQRPAQLTIPATPVVPQNLQTGTTYHVPRGPAVVANLAAPRGNVGSVRTPILLTAQSAGQAHSFVRPPRTPSPAQGTAWLNTNTSNGSQMKGAPTVLSSPVRGATVTGKPQLINRTQPSTQGVQTLRPATAILHSAITIGQPGQIHSFKSNQGAAGIQALNTSVTLAQVLPPPRTQAIVYNPTSNNQFITASRVTVAAASSSSSSSSSANAVQNPRQAIVRPNHLTTARVTLPTNQINAGRLLTSGGQQGAVLTSIARTSAPVPAPAGAGVQQRIAAAGVALPQQQQQQTVTINRLPVCANNVVAGSGAQAPGVNNIGQARILHSLVAVANSQAARNVVQTTGGAKVITQAGQGTIHLTPITTPIKTTHNSSTPTIPRTINVPAALVAQRPGNVVPSQQTIPIVKAFSSDNPQNSNVFIHASVSSNVSHRATPSPTGVVATTQPNNLAPTTTLSAYSIASGTYFYDASGTYTVSRSFGGGQNQSNSNSNNSSNFATITQQQSGQQQPMRQAAMGTQVHNIVTNQQQMRYNSVMVVDQGRTQPFSQSNDFVQEQQQQQSIQQKTTASPRPSILRKRDHEGSPLKAAKNLNASMSVLSAHAQQPQQHLHLQPQHHPLPPHTSSSHQQHNRILNQTHQQQQQQRQINVSNAVTTVPAPSPSAASIILTSTSPPPPLSPSPGSESPLGNNGGNSSGGSTTISATSSPGLADDASSTLAIINDERRGQHRHHHQHHHHHHHHPTMVTGGGGNSNGDMVTMATNRVAKMTEQQQQEEDEMGEEDVKSLQQQQQRHQYQQLQQQQTTTVVEMSPRKKPRKQQLTSSGNDVNVHNDDMQFISDHRTRGVANVVSSSFTTKKNHQEQDIVHHQHHQQQQQQYQTGRASASRAFGVETSGAGAAAAAATVNRRPACAGASLLNSYRQTWKATNNHFSRYSDVRPKDERKPSVVDLANQFRVRDKVNGWKVHHLSTQMEDLADQESTVYTNLSDLLKRMEKDEEYKSDKDINRINELIKGNLQRIKIISDGMNDAKSQIMRVFDHKSQVTDIINRCASKRNFKKREKS